MHPVAIRDLPARRVVGLPHTGPYPEVGPVFRTVWTRLVEAGAQGTAQGGVMVALSDPDGLPAAELQSFAGVLWPEDAPVPAGLEELRLAGGRHAVLAHTGSYATLQAAYDWLFGTWMEDAGEMPGRGPCHEVYLNDPSDTPEDQLRTDIFVPLT
jgi:AraC family transcriptional regulator